MSALLHQHRRKAVVGLLGAIGLTIAVAGASIALEEERMLASCFSVGAASVMALIVLWIVDQRQWPRTALAGAMICAVCLVGSNVLVWMEPYLRSRTEEFWAKLVALVGLAGFALIAFAGPLTFRFRKWWWHLVPIVCTIAWIALCAIISLMLMFESVLNQIERTVGFGVIIATVAVPAMVGVATVIMLPLMRMLERMPASSAEASLGTQRIPIGVECPRCGSAAKISANETSHCAVCNLRMRVEVEEPRCSCGYLLHHLKAPICPECGALIPLANNWSPQAITGPTGPPSA